MRRIALLSLTLFSSAAIAQTQPVKKAKKNKDPSPEIYKAPSNSTNLMTTSTSPASGMAMGAKYMPVDFRNQTSDHPIISLRKNQSDAQFDLGMGSYGMKMSGKNVSADIEASLMHIGLSTTIVSSMGIRFGAHMDIADDPSKAKITKPINTSTKTKYSHQDLSFFAAAGLTPNFGIALNMLMADHKNDDKHETATLISPAVMAMLDSTEIIFDIIQSNEDVTIDGHWRVGVVHHLQGDIYATGQMTRFKPYNGDDFWGLDIGARKKVSTLGSMGAEFIYAQQQDNDNGNCASPSTMGVRGDLDHELSSSQVASLGASFQTGSCSNDGTELKVNIMQAKAAYTMMF